MNEARWALLRQGPGWAGRAGADGLVVVSEDAKDGLAAVRLEVGTERRVYWLNLSKSAPFEFLREAKNADGHLLVEASDGWVGVIVECKHTLRNSNARDQLRWGAVRLLFVSEFLGVSLSRLVGIVATTADVQVRKRPVGERPPDPPPDVLRDGEVFDVDGLDLAMKVKIFSGCTFEMDASAAKTMVGTIPVDL